MIANFVSVYCVLSTKCGNLSIKIVNNFFLFIFVFDKQLNYMRKVLLLIFVCFLHLSSHSQCWQSVSAGGSHTIGIRTGGTLWSWGRNNFGQLGTAGVPSSSSNVPIQVGFDSDWSMVSAGSSFAVVLKTNGTIWGFGLNTSGQLGNNSTTNASVPIQIGADSDWAYISSGDAFTLAIKNNGTLWGWGDNTGGQLGNGTSGSGNMMLVPTQIGTSNWLKVSGGTNHTLAIKTDGTLWGWGTNNNGKLGNGTTVDSYVPIQISALTTWQSVMAGQSHSVAKKNDGTVWTWGDNTNGQLGDGTSGATAYKTSPQNIGMSVSTSIARGYQHTLLRKNDGKLYAWGGNTSGQLGDGSNTQKVLPVLINNDSDWVTIDSKATHTVALKSDGSLYAWGSNLNGKLGDGTFVDKNVPTIVNCPFLATENFSLINKIKLYPNPVQNELTIELLEAITLDKISITDLSGKKLIEKITDFNTLNVASLAQGIYLLEIFSKEGNLQTKFVKN